MTELAEPYLKKWNLKDPSFAGKGVQGDVYKVTRDGQAYALKVYNEIGLEYEQDAAPFLKYIDGHGTAFLIEQSREAILLEYCDGPILKTLVKEGQDDEASQIAVDILNKIHSRPIPKSHSFNDFERRNKSLFERAGLDRYPFLEQPAKLARHYHAQDTDIALLHGDMHHENIIKGPRGWVAIDPHPFIGPRIYDAANVLCNPFDILGLIDNKDRFLKQANIISMGLNTSLQKLIDYVFIHLGLSISWSIDDGEEDEFIRSRLRMMEMVKPMVEV